MKNTQVNKIIIFFVLLALSACLNSRYQNLPLAEFMRTVELKQTGMFTKTIGKVNYLLQFKPIEYVLIKELKEDVSDENKLTKLKKEHSKFDYYTLEISIDDFREEILKYDLKSESDYSERVKYYAFKFQNDLKMIQDKDTMPCIAYHFERNYGVSPKVRFLMAFEKINENSDRTFVCNEPFLGSGTIKINIDPNALKDIPSLKLN